MSRELEQARREAAEAREVWAEAKEALARAYIDYGNTLLDEARLIKDEAERFENGGTPWSAHDPSVTRDIFSVIGQADDLRGVIDAFRENEKVAWRKAVRAARHWAVMAMQEAP